MDHQEGKCRYTGMDKEYTIEDLAAFHGHLGPYIVLGYMIGRYARQNLCSDPFQMKAEVFCQDKPPQSCLADGVQIGSGCTLGKRNIRIVPSNEIRCHFAAGERELVIIPRPIAFTSESGKEHDLLIEQLAEKMYRMADTDLFTADLRPDWDHG
ncbi:formylmethanofuran dehydrogenase subunit E family protein [Methanothrix soehngenii]|uniref:formylmethanofuran dehydrogenase subunit E family protein n=1 Tax=Methanothrix soehngenii TaxID=2223 RepID=UPI002FE09726